MPTQQGYLSKADTVYSLHEPDPDWQYVGRLIQIPASMLLDQVTFGMVSTSQTIGEIVEIAEAARKTAPSFEEIMMKNDRYDYGLFPSWVSYEAAGWIHDTGFTERSFDFPFRIRDYFDDWEITLSVNCSLINFSKGSYENAPAVFLRDKDNTSFEYTFNNRSQPIADTIELGQGDIQITLTWDTQTDVDLHVVEPSGEEIFFETNIQELEASLTWTIRRAWVRRIFSGLKVLLQRESIEYRLFCLKEIGQTIMFASRTGRMCRCLMEAYME